MTEYELNIKIPNSGNKHIQYKENLTGSHESYPEDFFRIDTNREKIRKYIETQSQRAVSNKHLDQIIKQWIDDIKLGYSPSTVTLDLPSITFSGTTLGTSKQTISTESSQNYPTAKVANKGGQTKNIVSDPWQSETTSTANQGKQAVQVNQGESKGKSQKVKKPSEEPEETVSKTFANTNEADF